MSGGHLCEAEAPTEATAETSAPPVRYRKFVKDYSSIFVVDGDRGDSE